MLLLILMAAGTATRAEIVRRTLVSQNYETAQAADWQGDPGATITLATDDAVNGTCVQIEATEGNVGVWLPVQLPDEVFYRDQYMSCRGYVVEFDFMIRSGNVADVSQSQFFVLTQGTYPYYGGDVVEPDYSNLIKNGQTVSYWSSSYGCCLSQPMRTESTYSTEWFMSYSNQGTAKVFESDKWYHFSAYPEYVEEGQYPGFWFNYTIREKETGTWIYGGGSSKEGLARFTGLCALVGEGGMLKFDNLEVYDYSNYTPPTFELTGINGAERTYKITNPNEGDCTLYYTNAVLDAQPPVGHSLFIRSTEKETTVTVTGTGNLYAYVGTDDNDNTPSLVTVQAVNGVKQTLMSPFHWPGEYNAETNTCDVWLESDQSWLEYLGDNMPQPDIMYAIDDGDFQPFSQTGFSVPIGSQLKYYATLEGYNDSPTVTVTAAKPIWNLGLQDVFWEVYGWDYSDKTPITLGEEVETGLYQMTANSNVFSDHLLTPNENINDQFMLRNYTPVGGKEVYGARREASVREARRMAPEKVVKKTRILEEVAVQGIYSGDTRTYAIPDVKEGAYIMLVIQSVENQPVVTAEEGVEVDDWSSEKSPDRQWIYLKVTATGTARFTVNDGSAIYQVGYYEPAPPQVPNIYMQSLDGVNRTYSIYSEGATKVYYTTEPAAEQPAIGSDAWSVASNSSVQVTTTGQGNIYAYGENSLGTSEVSSVYVNGVALTIAPPVIRSKSQDYDTKVWTVYLYNPQNYVDGFYTNAKMYYSIDGSEPTKYKEAITVPNGSQLSFYTEALGFTTSPTITCTAGSPTINEMELQYQWNEYYNTSSYSTYRNMTLGDESEVLPGWHSLLADGYQLSNGYLLTQDENINDQFQLKYYGLWSQEDRTYAVAGLNTEQYLYIVTNDGNDNAIITPIEGLQYDAWNSSLGKHYYKVTTNGAVKFRINGKNYLRGVYLYQEPQYGYVDLADANGNTLKYYYESAESDAEFYGVTSYAADAEKAGHIIIADKVTDRKGREHNVTSVTTGVDNRSSLKSVVFGQNIKSIGNSAFYGCQQLESITLNSNLETLSSSTFENCYKLASVNLQDTKVTAIPSDCFYRCGLTEINIPATITEVGNRAFYGCDSAVVVTVNVANIPESCFQPYSSDKCKLQTINIGKDVKSIGNSAFRNQKQVTAVIIDSEVSGLTIGEYAFRDLDALTTITLPKGVASLGTGVFSYCDNLTTVVFDEASTIEAIPQSCFYECKSLEKLTFPNSVKTVGYSSFYNCTNLRELTFGTGLETNGFVQDNWNYGYLFNNCTSMEKMTLPGVNFPFQCQYYGLPNSMTLFVNADIIDEYKESSYTNIYHIVPIGATTDFDIALEEGGKLSTLLPATNAANVITLTISGKINGTDVNWIHQGMPYLQELILTNAQIVEGGEAVKRWTVSNDKVTQYGSSTYTVKNDSVCDYMFNNMPTLKHIALPDGAKYIGKYALTSNSKLEQVDMPTALKAIDNEAFNGDSKLSKADLPAGLLTIGQSAFAYTSITSVTVPEGVKSLSNSAFYECEQLKTVVLPDGLETIGNSAFYDCYNLESVNIPAQVATIGDNAFSYCNKLQSPIIIPASCMSIGSYAFNSNYMLTSVTFSDDPNAALTTIGGSAFSNCNKLEQVTLPESLTSLGNSAFRDCDALTSFVFPANIKQVPSSILYSCDNLESVTLAEGTTQIGSSAFYYCPKLATINLDGQPLTKIEGSAFSYTALTTVTLPESLTTMGSSVFAECTKLESANIPSQIKTVPSSTFSGCTSLTSVTLHDGITQIESNAFENCKLLPSVALTNQVTYIGSYAFSGCEALVMEALPTSLKTIDSYAFQNTKAMSVNLTMPETLTTLGYQAFYGSGITGVVFTKMPTSFSSYVFYDCKQLATVTLPADMTTIPDYTFYGTTALKTIDLPLGLTKISDGAFYQSGLETINLPQSLLTIGGSAFFGTQLEEIRVPKKVTSVGNRFAANCKKLKTAYLGRSQNYDNNNSFDYFAGCDNLELLRVYAGTPPKISISYYYSSGYLYYTGYRKTCVLEVPEGQVETYQAAATWKEFKDIRTFKSDDMLNDLDFAVMKDLYKYLNGASWEKPWDLTNQNHSIGKWKGITTEADAEDDELYYITAIDLTGQGLVGPLPKSVFTLERLKTLNMSHNTIEAEVDTLLTDNYEPLTTLNMEGNHLKGDLYPFVSKLPNLTNLNVSYNWLTAYSQPTSNSKLDNYYMYRGYQFVDWKTKEVNVPEELADEVIIDFTPGTSIELTSNTLQIYRHEHGDYNLSFSNLYRLYKSGNSMDYSSAEISKRSDNLWNLNTSNPLKAPKGLVAYTHTHPYYSCITYIFRLDWKDGDVNADQILDVADVQNVVYYALNESKPNNQVYNFTAADMNSDNKINVSDIVGCVDLVLDSTEPEATGARIYSKVEGESRNVMTATANGVLLANADEVAALQLTVSGANAAQLQLNSDLRSRFSVSMRDVTDGVRIVVYSPMGNTLAPGEHQLLSGLPAGATVTDVRLVDSEAQRLSVRVIGSPTAIDELMADDMDLETMPIYDLSGRRVGKWNTLPRGIYIVNLNGKQFKVRK